ncbi:carboxypeptidase-like regulatory domain-containing protein [Rufibacter glacialis]|nr:carboxypeptidase-like regulatory domain-containing protein [Rufibacter glacialis]
MTPQNQGRFCQSCQKTVVDFTAMPDAEVVEWLAKNKNTKCGRFRKDQIGKELTAPIYSPKRWNWPAAVLGLTAWLSTTSVVAKQVSSPVYSTNQRPASENRGKSMKELSEISVSLLVLKGTVIDAQSKEAMPGTTILLKGTSIAVPADQNGHFELAVPAYLVNRKQKVIFAFIGYEMKEVKLSKLLKKNHPKIIMALDTAVLGGIAIQFSKPIPDHGFLQRIKQLFS